jgi:membrane-associated phospholipid phosphatase
VGFGAARALTTTYVPVLLSDIHDAPWLIGLVMLINAAAGFTVPFIAGIAAIGKLPESASFPSGHSTTAFAAAVAIAIARPALRVWALAVAAVVAVSRVYLGMHYLGDVLGGALLGSAIGAGIVLLGRRALPSGMTRALRPA